MIMMEVPPVTQRTRNRLTLEFVILAVLVGALLGWQIPDVLGRRLDAYNFFDPVVDIRAEILRNYVEEVDEKELLHGAINGMLEQLDDPYTVYFTAEQLQSFEKHTRGTFSGIGAEIDQRDGYIGIVSPLEDSPAFEAGIVAGDLILAVDGNSLEGVSTEEAVKRITGPEDTPVTLTVRHPDGTEEKITIVRQRIEIETVKGLARNEQQHWDYMLDPNSKVGYIRMTQFSQPTYDALTSAMDELQTRGMRGLILDLRFNPGGLLDTAVDTADLFLDDGTIVSTRSRSDIERKWEAESDDTLSDFPMVVLVNEASASASEILAGALKYNDRAIVLGTRTVGKGSVQQIIPLDGGSGGVKLTTSLYYMPNGQNIHRHPDDERWGVDPSDGFYVALSSEELKAMLEARRNNDFPRPSTDPSVQVDPNWVRQHMADPQLAAALKTMQVKLGTGDWKKVGPSNTAILVHLSRRERLEKQRDQIMQRVHEIDDELEQIDRIIAEGDPNAVADPNAGATEAETGEDAATAPTDADELEHVAP